MGKTGKAASAVWFFNYVVKRDISSAQVMMLTASANLGFASHPPLLFWVGRFMMMVDAVRAQNRKVFGDLKFEGANAVEQWDPNSDLPQRINSKAIELPKFNPLKSTIVTGPDGKAQSHGDTLAGWSMPSPCPFSDV